MDPVRELLAIDHRRTLQFFFTGLRDVSESTVDRQALLYNASILAHYAQVSTAATVELPAPSSLGTVFEHFVLDPTVANDGLLLETAGAQCLLLAGFFEGQMRHRHSIRWYADLGAGFFIRAARHQTAPHRARLLESVGRTFEDWRRRSARLGRELRVGHYLLTSPRPFSPPPGPSRR